MVGGVEASEWFVDPAEKIDGGPSVVFDAVAVLLSDAGAQLLSDEATARDFVANAFAHCELIAHNAAAMPLLQKVGVVERNREGSTLTSLLRQRSLSKPAASSGFGSGRRRSSGSDCFIHPALRR
jgi:hypothetical protein